MATFVLVHGAFYGGWCWKHVRALLRQAGHEVFTPTLTGSGERHHLLSREVSLATHVQDIVQVLEHEDLRDVVLVGHSYGGMVITGVADRLPGRLRHLVYLDAHLPDPGQAASGAFSEGTADVLQSLAQAQGEAWLLPPLPLHVMGVTRPEDVEWAQPRRVPHPLHTLNEPLPLHRGPSTLPGTYIRCSQREGLLQAFGTDPLAPFFDKARQRGFRFLDIDSGHDAMIAVPQLTAQALLEALSPAP
ncbi:alpha/beta fold hydrolase [Myxococcus sp. RHSTA-1-4]|uniref:alpha/beta fold hydrolase n=1 Tax=Myxococcus sp. RHSTA-1-4 TaxID=2874601 RepID=UPI001CC1B54D|nr:alpha/beta fold hydrolase [Myxococcus sp. RHSTA-1-4]MBZ4422368.1 alpha/beta fold hydrolase [Myxococcus sp. RHSTA-1-4]